MSLSNASQQGLWERFARFGARAGSTPIGFNAHAGKTGRGRSLLAAPAARATAAAIVASAGTSAPPRPAPIVTWEDVSFAVTIGARTLEARFPTRRAAAFYADKCAARLPAGSPAPRIVRAA